MAQITITPDMSEPISSTGKSIVPEKSRDSYIAAYNKFLDWQKSKKKESFGEDVVMTYFEELSKTLKPPSLWSVYAMLKSTFIANNNIDIRTYPRLMAYLKEQSNGYVSNKAKVLTSEEVERFLNEAPDETYLGMKGRAASVSQSLSEALDKIVIINNPHKITEEYDNNLVYFNGPLWINEPLTEPDYGVIVECVKLKRRVQIYQWIEIEEDRVYAGEIQEDKNYFYTTEWKDKLVDSDSFYIRLGHENPKEMPLKSQIQIADQVKIGNIYLGSELKKKFNDFIQVTSDQRPERSDIKMHAGLYYHSRDLWNPRVGDIRILLSYAGKAGDTYTIIGKLVDGNIVPFVTSQGNEILLHRKHKVSVDRMFHLEHVHNYWRTWLIRGIGWLVIFISITLLANILQKIILKSAYLCEIIATDSLAITISMSISLLVISLAWIWYRPIIAICLTFASILPFLYCILFPCVNQTQQQHQRIQ